jgi:hypothetical protein
MIPTRYRDKLPREQSYPVGAGAISEAQADAPHVEALSVAFQDQAVWHASEFRRILSERQPYRILEASFRPASKPGISASKHMIELGWYDEVWEIQVYPVLAEFRHRANRLLIEQGLPGIARWLRSSDRSGWVERSHRVELIFIPVEESLVVREHHGV